MKTIDRVNYTMAWWLTICITILWPCLHASAKSLNVRQVDTSQMIRQFTSFVEAIAPWDKEEMEISELKVLPRTIWVPEGEIKFQFSEPRTGTFLGKISSVVTIYVDDKPVRKARVCAYIECFKKVLCSKRGLIRGQVITANDLHFIKMPISKLKGKFFEDPREIIGLASKRTIRPGQVIYGRSLMKPMVVKRGSKVLIVAKSPTLEITCPGIAMEQGSRGDFVRVKNLQSKRVIIARVHDQHTVYVSF